MSVSEMTYILCRVGH